MSDDKRREWMRSLLLVIDDFQHIDTGDPNDADTRVLLAALMLRMYRLENPDDPRLKHTTFRRCVDYPDCECEIWEVCATV